MAGNHVAFPDRVCGNGCTDTCHSKHQRQYNLFHLNNRFYFSYLMIPILYRYLVRQVPKAGTTDTKHRYNEYLTLVWSIPGVGTTLSKGNGIRGSAERGHPTRFSLYDGRIGFAFHHLQQRAHRVLQLAAVRRVRTEVRQQADDNQRVGGVRMLVMERVRVGYQHPVDVVDVGKRRYACLIRHEERQQA